jgi:DNA-binding MarR family transcriptional regulator
MSEETVDRHHQNHGVADRRRSTHARRLARGRNFAYSLYITGSLVSRLLEEELAPSKLTASDLGLLSAIGLEEGVTPTALAGTLGVRPSTLTTQIRGLVRRRYVRRLENPADGRSYRLALTPTGRRVWQDAAPALRSALARVERELRIDIDELEDALAELERALQAALARRP